MLKKLADFVIRFRIIVFALILAAAALSASGIYFLQDEGRINSDMLDYIGDGYVTRDGLDFLHTYFNVDGDAMFAVEGSDNDQELSEIIGRFSNYDGVRQIVWYGTLGIIDEMTEEYGALFKLLNIDPASLTDTETLKGYLKRPAEEEGKYYYVVLMLTEYSPSSKDGFALLDTIKEDLSPRKTAFAGMTETASAVMRNTFKELPYYLIIGGAVILAILLLTTTSFMEALIILMSLAAAILINLGSSYLLPEVSIVGYAASAVLQLGVTLDYAVLLLHNYKKKRRLLPPLEAAKQSLPSVWTFVICASLVTAGALSSLFFMKFSLGKDVAIALIKGVLVSMAVITVLVPALLYTFDKAIVKTSHKSVLTIASDKPHKALLKKRVLLAVITLIVAVPALILPANIKKSFFKIYDNRHPDGAEIIAEELGNQLILTVPVKTKAGYTQQQFIEEVESLESVGLALGAFSAINLDGPAVEGLLDYTKVLSRPELSAFFKKKDGVWYTMYMLVIKGNVEKDGVDMYRQIKNITDKYFDDAHSFGVLTGVYDMSMTTERDFKVVTAISAAAVFLLSLLFLKSLRKSLMTVFLVELGVFINLALASFTGSVNFLIYIVIGAVQTGCTVNYAFFVSAKYSEIKRNEADSVAAATKAAAECTLPVLTGAALLAATCAGVFLTSNNLIVKDMAALLARGGIIGAALSLIVLPGLLSFYKESKYPRFLNKFIGNK